MRFLVLAKIFPKQPMFESENITITEVPCMGIVDASPFDDGTVKSRWAGRLFTHVPHMSVICLQLGFRNSGFSLLMIRMLLL